MGEQQQPEEERTQNFIDIVSQSISISLEKSINALKR